MATHRAAARRLEERQYAEELQSLMRRGATTQMSTVPPRQDFGLYPEALPGDDWVVAQEMDRSEARGAIRWVEDEQEAHFIHPWVVVHTCPDGKPKVRACGDYSVGLNKWDAAPPPFRLPRPWDVRRWADEDTYFAKYDISDGFWMLPINEQHMKYFGYRMPPNSTDPATGKRHPRAGQVALCTRVPFGWSWSPALFCSLTEGIAERLRTHFGVQVIAFVDDFLLAGPRDKLVEAMKLFEAEMAALGVCLAPHKTEGPRRIIKFLGLLLTNVKGERSISLPEDKWLKLVGMMDHYAKNYQPGNRVAPQQLAKMLGLLNFAAMVVDGGELFLDRMYSSFRHCTVDWKRGLVIMQGQRRPMLLTAEFFEDLKWWRENLSERNAVPLLKARGGGSWDRTGNEQRVGVVSGTDASGMASGGLAWLAGDREEVVQQWSSYEVSLPINYRELAGAVALLEEWGPRLRGMRLHIETDNMSSMYIASVAAVLARG